MLRNFDFIGWVPCVSGRLRFELTSCDSISDKGFLNTNHIEENNGKLFRYLAIASLVPWQDFEEKEDGFSKNSGDFYVNLIASAELNTPEIKGWVFLTPKSDDNASNQWQEKITPLLKSISETVKEKEEVKEPFKKLHETLLTLSNDKLTYKVEFLLKENGFTYLNLSSSISDMDDTESFIICRQAYYYIKYTFHKHTHHPKAESLTSIHSTNNQKEELGLILINDIKKSLVLLKRLSEPNSYRMYFASKGILSYCKSLAISARQEGLLSDQNYQLEKEYIENIGQSLETTGKRIESDITTESLISTNFRAVVLFLFAIVAPFTVVYKDKIPSANTPSYILDALRFLFINPWGFPALIGSMICVYFWIRIIYLKYGTTKFALSKFKLANKYIFERVVHDPRSASLLACLLWIFIIFILGVLVFR